MARRCPSCMYSSGGSPDPFSDICDECQSEPNVGWFGSTDGSYDDDGANEEDTKFLDYPYGMPE